MVRFAVLFVILGAFITVSGQPKRVAAAKELVGAWKLVSYENRDANGTTVYPYGISPTGLLIYDSTGHMAIQIMKNPPPQVASADWDKFSVTEKIALYDGYVAYFGRFEVDVPRQVVIHLPEADLSRLYIGRREERHFELSGDRLIISVTRAQGGSGFRVFQRLK